MGLCIFLSNKQDGNKGNQFHSELKFIFLLDLVQKLFHAMERLPLISVPVDVVFRPQPEASHCTALKANPSEVNVAWPSSAPLQVGLTLNSGGSKRYSRETVSFLTLCPQRCI